MGILTYDSNNSGGFWWLTDENWQALDDDGWTVHWGARDYFDYKDPRSVLIKRDKTDERWIRSLATTAAIETDNPRTAIERWERVADQNVSDQGCNSTTVWSI